MATSNLPDEVHPDQMDVFECIEVAEAERNRMIDLQLHTASWTGVMRYAKEQAAVCPTCGQPSTAAPDLPFQPVRISVGTPRFWSPARGFPVARKITPYGLRNLSGSEFTVAYLKRLDGDGIDLIKGELYGIAKEAGGKPLALLCFEAEPNECHRGQFAAWWEKHTGEPVTELDLATSDNPE